MRKINKEIEPNSLTLWKSVNPTKNYTDLTPRERIDIRSACLSEQYYLCAYCCQAITGQAGDCMNEHVEARDIAPQRSLDYTNIVASCTSRNQCDNAHAAKPLPLTPFMDECETEFRFKISGRVEGLSDRAQQAIHVLNLGDIEQHNRALIEKRKQLVSILMLKNGVDANDGLEDDPLLESVIEDISSPTEGRLEAFSPVMVNILRQWISA